MTIQGGLRVGRGNAQDAGSSNWPTTPFARHLMALSAISRSMWATMFRHRCGPLARPPSIENKEISKRTSTFPPSAQARRASAWMWNCPTPAESCSKRSKIDFVSPQVDTDAAGHSGQRLRCTRRRKLCAMRRLIKARVIWSTKPMAVVPVLAVTRQGGQTFCVSSAQAAERPIHCCRRHRSRWATRWKRLLHHLRLERRVTR